MIKYIGVFFLLMISLLVAQTNWVKYANNPVMVKQNLLTEFYAIGQPTVIKENDTFKMWYCGAGIDHRSRVLYAYSANGINWTKYLNGAIVLNIGSAGEWDSKWLDTPEIVRTPTDYKLYYFGDVVDTFPPHSPAIGVATSSNGVNWTKYSGNPVLRNDSSLFWEAKWIESPAILYDEGIYKMWYTGVGTDWRIKIGYATSPDGFIWTKYPNNPVVSVGSPGSFDDYWVGVPAVIKRGNRFEMWYSAMSEADLSNNRYDTVRIGYATSYDGINWTKFSGNPVLSTLTPPYNPAIDSNGPWAPDVVFDGAGYRMWYETAAGFCYATATLGIEENGNSPINYPIRISPNPSKDMFILSSSILKNQDAKIRIYNSLGVIIKEIHSPSKEQMIINITEKGIFFIIIESGEIKITRKVIIAG